MPGLVPIWLAARVVTGPDLERLPIRRERNRGGTRPTRGHSKRAVWQYAEMSWRPGVEENLGYYVYLLADPADSRVFYVGKGVGGRCFSHLEEARKTTRDSKGDYEKLAQIRQIEERGDQVRIEILRHGLTDAESFQVEAASIDLLGLSDLSNRVKGHGANELGRMGVNDLNARYGATPVEIAPEHKVMLIRVTWKYSKAMSGDDLYEATRAWWKVNPKRGAEYAMSVHGGVVRAVYEIDSWVQPTARQVEDDPPIEGRHAFVGRRAPNVEKRYLFGDVTSYLTVGAQNPIRYVNC